MTSPIKPLVSASSEEGPDLDECADCGGSTAPGSPDPHDCSLVHISKADFPALAWQVTGANGFQYDGEGGVGTVSARAAASGAWTLTYGSVPGRHGSTASSAVAAIERLHALLTSKAPTQLTYSDAEDIQRAATEPTRIRWKCGGCLSYFGGAYQKVCPACGREGFWSGSYVAPDVYLASKAEADHRLAAVTGIATSACDLAETLYTAITSAQDIGLRPIIDAPDASEEIERLRAALRPPVDAPSTLEAAAPGTSDADLIALWLATSSSPVDNQPRCVTFARRVLARWPLLTAERLKAAFVAYRATEQFGRAHIDGTHTDFDALLRHLGNVIIGPDRAADLLAAYEHERKSGRFDDLAPERIRAMRRALTALPADAPVQPSVDVEALELAISFIEADASTLDSSVVSAAGQRAITELRRLIAQAKCGRD